MPINKYQVKPIYEHTDSNSHRLPLFSFLFLPLFEKLRFLFSKKKIFCDYQSAFRKIHLSNNKSSFLIDKILQGFDDG